MSWNRKLWGVEFASDDHGERYLLGSLWHESPGLPYTDEPTRALLFNTRKGARHWCSETNKKWKLSPVCSDWRVHPVRVREKVSKQK